MSLKPTKGGKINLAEVEKKLRLAAQAYYNTDTKLMSDQDFDDLKDAWEKASGKRFEVGASPNVSSTVTLSHSYDDLAGTLDKVVSTDQMKDWLRRRGYKVSRKTPLYVSLKYDGHSVNAEFKKNRLSAALTRGKDGIGKDLTGYFRNAWGGIFKGKFVPPQIDGETIEDFAFGFEAVISWENLEKLNAEFSTSYKNPRSAIGGIIKENGIPMAKYLTLIPLKYRAITGQHVTRIQEIDALLDLAESQSCFDSIDMHVVESVEELEELYKSIAENRFDLPYMIDGIVVEIVDQDVRENLGYSDNRPCFAVAFKLPYMEQETRLKDVEWYTDGNSATYTPVAVLEPVMMNGATYQNVSLANYRRFKEMNLQKNDRMLFSLNNDVLGYVEKLPTVHPRGKEDVVLVPPSYCECCGEKLKNDSVFLFCDNDACDLVKIGRLQQFIEKMGIKGIKRNTIKALYDKGYVEYVHQFLDFDDELSDRLAKEDGFGKSSAKIIVDAIHKKLYSEKGVYDYELLGSLNIPLFGRSRAKLILKHVSVETLVGEKPNRLEQKLLAIDGVDQATVDVLFRYQELIEETFKVFSARVKVRSFSQELKENQVEGQKYTVVVTGNLKGYGRDEFKEAIERLGHKMASSISRKTDYLITNDTSSGTIKNQKATELGVKIIDEQQAIDILGINRNSRKKVSIDEVF
jgi:DNA ligase (NAD+)